MSVDKLLELYLARRVRRRLRSAPCACALCPARKPSPPHTRSSSSSFSAPPIPTPIRVVVLIAASPRRPAEIRCRSGWAHAIHGCTTSAGRHGVSAGVSRRLRRWLRREAGHDGEAPGRSDPYGASSSSGPRPRGSWPRRYPLQLRKRAPTSTRLASTNGFATGWSIGATAVSGAANRSPSGSSGPPSRTARSRRAFIKTVTASGWLSRRPPPAARWGGRLSIKPQRGRRHRHDRRRNQIASATWSAASSPRRDVTFLATPRAIASHSSSVLARMASAARSATMPGRTYSVLCNSRFAFTQLSILSPQPRNLSAAGNEFSVLNLQFDNIQWLKRPLRPRG